MRSLSAAVLLILAAVLVASAADFDSPARGADLQTVTFYVA